MGNTLSHNIIQFKKYNVKSLSKILELEGWVIKEKNNEFIYYKKFQKIEVSDYPDSISDYEDIYDFYNTEMLNPYETLDLLKNYIIHNSLNLLEEEHYKIQNIIRRIEQENDISEFNIGLIGFCCST